MPARYEGVPVWKTHGRYRKGMKCGYNKILYNQRNKDETIASVIKRLFGEHIISMLIRTQNSELTLKCIAYNVIRKVKLVVMVMVFTEPIINKLIIIIKKSFIENHVVVSLYVVRFLYLIRINDFLLCVN